MITGRIDSYKGFIRNKKIYLKRKKQLNRAIRHYKKVYRKCKSKGYKGSYFKRIMSRGKDDIYILRIMWNLRKFQYRKLRGKR